MSWMFYDTHSFNQDLSVWNVSAVTNMDGMFHGATSFDQTLCGVSWVNSKATQLNMFRGSPGSISSTVCTVTSTTTTIAVTSTILASTLAFSPQNRTELKRAVDACLKLSLRGNCTTGPHGPIGSWDVSAVTDMQVMFYS